jgi:hypothetical protein
MATALLDEAREVAPSPGKALPFLISELVEVTRAFEARWRGVLAEVEQHGMQARTLRPILVAVRGALDSAEQALAFLQQHAPRRQPQIREVGLALKRIRKGLEAMEAACPDTATILEMYQGLPQRDESVEKSEDAEDIIRRLQAGEDW